MVFFEPVHGYSAPHPERNPNAFSGNPRRMKPPRRRSLTLAAPQKNTLCSFHFARARFFLLLMKRVFFCGVLPSKYSGRWRGCPQFDFAKEKRNSPQTPLPLFLCSNGTGTEAGGQKFLPPNPPPFFPPASASPPKLFDGFFFFLNNIFGK